MAGVTFNIDTEELRSLAQTASQLNDSLTDAEAQLNAITVHNDWYCSERTRINQYTLENRMLATTLQSNAEAFYNAVKQSSDLADEAEQRYIQQQGNLDDVIATIVNAVPAIEGTSTVDTPNIADFSNMILY
ncbi:hypothetical protein AUL39_05160 [Tractidigestivibacter scatoligenes]|uniref:Uncharacterized protein n=1 Tax=Tractidigestivibacter scatoligenes TaxID=1299998 RepID=A0A100YVD4_TRASO|nr:hypothetical protein [Tractidigestivibacter scatoligenes]KUH58395.1 hypothetical protein AUL39_05160 [Tractidigestivibacter scatoligenes]